MQTHLTQYLVTIGILGLPLIMNASIQFNNQCRFVTVKIHNETRNDLLSAKMNPKFIPA